MISCCPMCVLLWNLMLAVQSINFVCMDFRSLYLLQMGAEICVSVADVDSDPLLDGYWPPSTFVHRGSCSEADFSTTDKKAWTRTEKYGRARTESVKSVFFGKVWPPLMNSHLVGSRSAPATNAQIWRGLTVNSRRLLTRRMRQTQDSSHRLSSYLATRKPKLATHCQRGYNTSDDTRCCTSTIGLVSHSPYQTALHCGLLWAAFSTVHCFTVDG